MKLEIIQITTMYPEVYVIKEGTFDNESLSCSGVVTRMHIDDARKLVHVFNNFEKSWS